MRGLARPVRPIGQTGMRQQPQRQSVNVRCTGEFVFRVCWTANDNTSRPEQQEGSIEGEVPTERHAA
jgi:hypothetical protein